MSGHSWAMLTLSFDCQRGSQHMHAMCIDFVKSKLQSRMLNFKKKKCMAFTVKKVCYIVDFINLD